MEPDGRSRSRQEHAEAELEKLNAFAISLLQQNSLEDLLWSMAEHIGLLLDFEDCVIYLHEGEMLVQMAAYGVKNPVPREIRNPISIPASLGVVGAAASTRQPILVRDTRTDPRYIHDEFDGLSELAVPILFENRVLGVIDSESSHLDAFSEGDLQMLQVLANIAASRIASATAERDRTKTQEELRRAHHQLESRVRERTAELAREKERLAITLQSVAEGIVAADSSGRIIFMSDAAVEMTGWSRKEAVERTVDQVIRAMLEDRSAPLALTDRRLLPRGDRGETLRAWLASRDGSERLISLTGARLRVGREAGGQVLVFRDITRQDRLEQEARRSQQLDSLGVLAGGIAHDFNNLLTVVLGNLNLAQLETVSPRSVDALQAAERACIRATSLTKQLLTFARGGAPILQAASIEEIVRESAGFALAGSDCSCEIDLPVLPPVKVDAGQISQVLHNLLLNARQAMPAGGSISIGGRTCTLSSPVGDVERSGVEIDIRDQGVGIPPQNLERIFEPYFSTKEHGSGLGLATSYRIVRRHGGNLRVESKPGEGATFVLALPVAETGPAEEPSRPTPPEGRAAHILLVDDESSVRTLLAGILGRLGHRVDTAADAAEAVAGFRRARLGGDGYDLVILDLTIPGGPGGRELLEALRRMAPEVRAIVASGYSNDPVLADHRSYGFEGLLQKPFDLDTVQATVSRVLLEG